MTIAKPKKETTVPPPSPGGVLAAAPPSFAASSAAAHGPLLVEWLGPPDALELLYSASSAEYTHRGWHAACDRHSPTLVIAFLEFEGVECVLGLFTPVAWEPPKDCAGKADSSGRTVLFALKNARGDAPYRLKSKAGKEIIRHDASLGPACVGYEGLAIVGDHPVLASTVPHSDRWEYPPGSQPFVGLLADHMVYKAPFSRVETWKW